MVEIKALFSNDVTEYYYAESIHNSWENNTVVIKWGQFGNAVWVGNLPERIHCGKQEVILDKSRPTIFLIDSVELPYTQIKPLLAKYVIKTASMYDDRLVDQVKLYLSENNIRFDVETTYF